ncbi:hypothetical protein R3P38DRAFT_1795446 [Favolaschia claudopus]|uniref:Peptidase C14 caspase domain-containing protein n=1 Tax=Favolaschia claudopus TaxID=2862362 RepID=A0AAW0A5F9_9AGAR
MAHIDLESGSQLSISRAFDSVSIPGNGNYVGQKRALLIGIRVCQSDGYADLEAAQSDVYKMRDLLIDVYQYEESEITILLDDGVHVLPTRDNILAAIAVFVKNVNKPNSEEEEDDLDEYLIPFDGVDMKIFENELHAALVQPLPSGSHLVAVLDICNTGSLLVRHGARLVTISQTTGSAPPATTTTQNAVAPQTRRCSVISMMCEPPTPSPPTTFPIASRASTDIPSDPSPSIARTGTVVPRSGLLARLRTLSVSLQSRTFTSPHAGKAMKTKENFTAGEVSPVMPTLSVEADVISLASCKDPQKAWEADGVSMTSALVELLRENPVKNSLRVGNSFSHS